MGKINVEFLHVAAMIPAVTGRYVGVRVKQAHYEPTSSAVSFCLYLTFYESDATLPNLALMFVFVTS